MSSCGIHSAFDFQHLLGKNRVVRCSLRTFKQCLIIFSYMVYPELYITFLTDILGSFCHFPLCRYSDIFL